MPSSDPRFARLKTDPRFRRPKKKETKVVIDDRFKSLLESTKPKKKKGKERVDKYGRPISENQENENLEKYYRLEKPEDADDPAPRPDYARGEALLESSDEEEPAPVNADQGEDSEDYDSDASVVRLDQGAEVDLDEDFDDLDQQAKEYAEANADDDEEESKADVQPTRRLAAVNLDWEHVKAVHLYKICSSVLAQASGASTSRKAKNAVSNPVVGRILNVRVYPSEFGKERMAREEVEGPPAEIFKKKDLKAEEINAQTIYDVGTEESIDEDALRKYQLERLRYYYAIITCDTVAAATHIYTELEGTELERSANIFDLSYVPDDMTFDSEWRDEASEESSIAYRALDFTTDALRHSKVKLTWDEDDRERTRTTRRTLTREEIENGDFRAYLASSGSEDEEESSTTLKSTKSKQASRDKMRALLLGGGNDDLPEGWGDKDDEDVDMQITFTPGLTGDDKGEETTIEKYQRKLKEKKKQRKEEAKTQESDKKPAPTGDDFFGSDSEGDVDEEVPKASSSKSKKPPREGVKSTSRIESTADELSLLASSDNLKEHDHFDMRTVMKAEKEAKRKGKKKRSKEQKESNQQDGFAIDIEDDRFKAIHEDPQYAIDPTNPHFKKTTSMNALLQARTKRRREADNDKGQSSGRSGKSADSSLTDLVERVKSKGLPSQEPGKRRKLS